MQSPLKAKDSGKCVSLPRLWDLGPLNRDFLLCQRRIRRITNARDRSYVKATSMVFVCNKVFGQSQYLFSMFTASKFSVLLCTDGI